MAKTVARKAVVGKGVFSRALSKFQFGKKGATSVSSPGGGG